MTIKTLVELAQAIEDGKEIEAHWGTSWRSFKDCESWTFKDLKAKVVNDQFRIKPEPKVIDLSVLIESGIDCDFWCEGGAIYIGKLEKISDICPNEYMDSQQACYDMCRPRMNHIHYWTGGDCPLPEGFKIKVHYRDGTSSNSTPSVWEWYHDTEVMTDIIAFEVLGKAEGWLYPWEVE